MTLADGEPQLSYLPTLSITVDADRTRASLMARKSSRISQRLLNPHFNREEAPVSDVRNKALHLSCVLSSACVILQFQPSRL